MSAMWVSTVCSDETDHLWNSFFQLVVKLTGHTIRALPILQEHFRGALSAQFDPGCD
jgi:hypothetical protein